MFRKENYICNVIIKKLPLAVKTVGGIFIMIIFVMCFYCSLIFFVKKGKIKLRNQKEEIYKMYNSYVKKFLDVFFSFLLIIILLPVMICIGIAIKIDSAGPILFKQNRIGKDKKMFTIFKFRTMKIETPSNVPTHLFNDSLLYITRVGKFLRVTSLDELPQLFNILMGQMSFIGPRPALWNQYDLIELRDQGLANKMVPGLTGLAQVKGRDELPLEIKANYDNEYASSFSLFMDIKILFLTVFSVLSHRGVKEGSEEAK